MPADLHIHSTASDGTLSPTQVVEAASRAGLRAISITDHDTTDGMREAQEAGRRLGIDVISGVEINTEVGSRDVHILGYFYDIDDEAFTGQIRALREGRLVRAQTMVNKLAAVNAKVELEHVLSIAHDAAVGRPHVARALVEAGYVSDLDEAFGRYLGRGKPAFVERMKYPPEEAMALIRRCGGIPVIAHPPLVNDDDLVVRMADSGAMGIEVYHARHKPKHVRRWREFARRRGLLITGGSDSHGPGGVVPVEIGSVTVSDEELDALYEAAARIRGV